MCGHSTNPSYIPPDSSGGFADFEAQKKKYYSLKIFISLVYTCLLIEVQKNSSSLQKGLRCLSSSVWHGGKYDKPETSPKANYNGHVCLSRSSNHCVVRWWKNHQPSSGQSFNDFAGTVILNHMWNREMFIVISGHCVLHIDLRVGSILMQIGYI